MTGGFRSSRYGNKFEEIAAAAKKDGERKPRTSGEIRDLVKDPAIEPLIDSVRERRREALDALA